MIATTAKLRELVEHGEFGCTSSKEHTRECRLARLVLDLAEALEHDPCDNDCDVCEFCAEHADGAVEYLKRRTAALAVVEKLEL